MKWHRSLVSIISLAAKKGELQSREPATKRPGTARRLEASKAALGCPNSGQTCQSCKEEQLCSASQFSHLHLQPANALKPIRSHSKRSDCELLHLEPDNASCCRSAFASSHRRGPLRCLVLIRPGDRCLARRLDLLVLWPCRPAGRRF